MEEECCKLAEYTDIYRRIWGNKDINEVKITTGIDDTLFIELEDDTHEEIVLDDATYKLTLTPRKSDIVDSINEKLSVNNIIECYLGSVHGDTRYECLVFKSKEGKNITSVTGSFAKVYFYAEDI